ncbi:MAG: restriction endonuclease [candidate division Zixibacteria bacterium]|nr:restriction endonuclease [candidate division Zixibacteria bacterium]
MSIPDYQTVMLPLLKLISDGQEHKLTDVFVSLAVEFKLTDDERIEMLGNGQRTFDNRVRWAKAHLTMAKLLEAPQRGILHITSDGIRVLEKAPDKIDIKFLMEFDAYVQHRNFTHGKRHRKDRNDSVVESQATPEETLEVGYRELRESLKQTLLENVMSLSPQFFEQLVVDLLVKMGYGGSRVDAGRAIGRSGDGGIDGIIKEDKLGLDVIYIQAKRWENTVGRPIVQAFAGSLDGVRAKRGVLITTSVFSSEADKYVKNIEKKIVLIDGERLTELMIDHNIGVSTEDIYEIKKIDSDYFIED